MRVIALLCLLPLAACGPDFWNQPATPAPSGISAIGHGTDPTGHGAEPSYTARGSQRTIGLGTNRY